ncbi:MAG: acyltransferase family protein [Bacteroidales bacterium]
MQKTERYLALDVLRGITVAFMILVNTPGSWQHIYAPLKHAAWHGCTPTDLVFPFFLFVVGVSMFFSFGKQEGLGRNKLLLKTLKRALLIFAIGLFLNSYPQWSIDFSQLRIMGVLQRIAVAYLLAALLVLFLRSTRAVIFSGSLILFAYWGILWMWGGEDPYSLIGNAAIGFDAALLGENHLYKGFIHEGQRVPFDPEGLLSSLPAMVTVLIGYLAGNLIKSNKKEIVPVKLMLWGLLFALAGALWGLVFPINKPLWTSSYVLYTAGLAAILFGILIWIIDLKGYRRWTSFFVVFGVNPLFLFALSGLWAKTLGRLIRIETADGTLISGSAWIYQNVFLPIAGTYNGSLLYAIAHVIVFWLIGWVLYRRKIFIKV